MNFLPSLREVLIPPGYIPVVLPHGERTIFIIGEYNSILKLLSSILKVCRVGYFVCHIAQTAQQVGSKRFPVGPTWIAINFN